MAEASLHEDYVRDGVVVVHELLTADEVKHVRDALARYIEEHVPGLPTGDVVFEADGKSVRNLWRLDVHDSFFADLANRDAVQQVVQACLGSEPVLMNAESFNKPAKVGSAVPQHQDNAYFCLSPSDALTVWIALDPVTDANGPVHYLRGSHRDGLRPHRKSGVAGNSMGLAEELDTHDAFAPLLNPGDALIHHSEVVHYSFGNKSDQSRCALLIVYRAAHCEKNPELMAAYTGAN